MPLTRANFDAIRADLEAMETPALTVFRNHAVTCRADNRKVALVVRGLKTDGKCVAREDVQTALRFIDTTAAAILARRAQQQSAT